MKNEIHTQTVSKISIPPGVHVKEKKFSKNGIITFADKRPFIPLPPLVEVYLSHKQHIKVSTVFFIDAAIKGLNADSFAIYQEFSISDSGTPQLQFFISYDAVATEAKDFQAYQISFKAVDENLPPDVSFADIKTIQTFIWDTDPVSSRGTVTNVQS